MTHEGVDPTTVTFRYGIAARYIGQLESFDTQLTSGEMSGPADIERMIDAFETMYTKVYPDGARFPDAGYSVTAVHLEAIAPKPQPVLAEYPLAAAAPSAAAFVGSRNVYHDGVWTPFNVYEMAALDAGNVVAGPAIIRDPMTTVVIPPRRSITFDKYRVLHYQ
jgi:N-methylhydantoinase A